MEYFRVKCPKVRLDVLIYSKKEEEEWWWWWWWWWWW